MTKYYYVIKALPESSIGNIRPSMLLDKMRALTPSGELDHPTSLFWYAFLLRLPPDIRVSCVLLVGVDSWRMFPGARTPSFGPGIDMRRRCRSAVF